jgi:hypothetical protein
MLGGQKFKKFLSFQACQLPSFKPAPYASSQKCLFLFPLSEFPGPDLIYDGHAENPTFICHAPCVCI